MSCISSLDQVLHSSLAPLQASVAMDSKSVAGSVAGIASQIDVPGDLKKNLRLLAKLVCGDEVIYIFIVQRMDGIFSKTDGICV